MATELGVARVVPLLTARTVVRLEPARWTSRLGRWQRVAKEAAKQSGRAVVPEIAAPRDVSSWAREAARDRAARLPLGGGARSGLDDASAGRPLPARDRGRGPRGRARPPTRWHGLADAGAVVAGLGPRLLRTETAGPVAVALLQSRYGDLGAARERRELARRGRDAAGRLRADRARDSSPPAVGSRLASRSGGARGAGARRRRPPRSCAAGSTSASTSTRWKASPAGPSSSSSSTPRPTAGGEPLRLHAFLRGEPVEPARHQVHGLIRGIAKRSGSPWRRSPRASGCGPGWSSDVAYPTQAGLGGVSFLQPAYIEADLRDGHQKSI